MGAQIQARVQIWAASGYRSGREYRSRSKSAQIGARGSGYRSGRYWGTFCWPPPPSNTSAPRGLNPIPYPVPAILLRVCYDRPDTPLHTECYYQHATVPGAGYGMRCTDYGMLNSTELVTCSSTKHPLAMY
eukprot:1940704-Rhodomonas_salina.1